MRRFTRLLPLLVILALLAAAAFVLLRAGPVAQHIRTVTQTELSQQLGRPVSIGSAGVTATGAVELKDVSIQNSDGSILLKVPQMQARVGGLRSLLQGKAKTVQIRSVRLVRPELSLARRPDGTWTISDLLARTSRSPSAFRGSITAEDARLVFVDETRGGQVTAISDADVTVKQPTKDRVTFAVRAGANRGSFDSFELRGESDRTKRLTRLAGEGTRISVPFAVERIPGLSVLSASAGTANLKGRLSFGGEPDNLVLDYDATADVTGAEISFPWLRRPAKAVEGRLRMVQGDIRLEGLKGTIEEAPVEVKGTIQEFLNPVFDLDLLVTGIRYPQVRALFPRVALPAGLLLPSAMRVNAKIEGPAAQIKVSGEATVKVIKFHAIPWHDLVGRFEYQDGRLKINSLKAHGSPRQFEANIEIDLTPHGPKALGSFSLANMPLSMLAEMAGIKGDFQGIARATVRGAIQLGGELRGDFQVDHAIIEGVDFGRLAGEFVYQDKTIRLRRVRVRGPTADGLVNADIVLPGAYKLSAELASLSLTALGSLLKLQGLRGQCCARLEASGQVQSGQATARIRLGPGELQGQPFQLLSANLLMTRGVINVRDISATAGPSQVKGSITVSGRQYGPERTRLNGRLQVDGLLLQQWLPEGYRGVALQATLSGEIALSGTVAQATVEGDLSGESASIAGRPLSVARGRVRYRKGSLEADQIELRTADGKVEVIGDYSQAAGFAIEAHALGVDLGDITPDSGTWAGFALHGMADLDARVTGPLTRPELSFDGKAYGSPSSPLQVNGVSLDEAVASGKLTRGSIHVDNAVLRWRDGSLTTAGRLDLEAPQPIDATADLRNVDLGSLLQIGDSALWRLYQRNPVDPLFRSPFLRRYALIPRPLTGRLTATATCSGLLTEPRIAATLTLTDLGFDSRRVQRVSGEVDLTAGVAADRQVGIRSGRVNLKATQEQTEAALTGEITSGGQVALDLATDNLDLRLLNPWLQLPAELGGQAKIDSTITGPLARPIMRGGIFVDNLKIGPFPAIESASIDPIWLRGGVLELEDIRLRNGPMETRGSMRVPLSADGGVIPWYVTAALLSTGELHLAEARFAPIAGMTPAKFEAFVHLANGRIAIRDGEGPTGPNPGIQGSMGTGRFSVGGDIALGYPAGGAWIWRPSVNVVTQLDHAEVAIPGLFDIRLTGAVELRDDPTGALVLTTQRGEPPTQEPLVASDGTLTFDQVQGIKSSLRGVFAPKLDVRVATGENLWFQRGNPQRPTRIRVEPAGTTGGMSSGYLDIGGSMSAAGATLNGQFESHEGRLSFPNGTLTLHNGTARVTRDPGKKPVVIVSAEAEGRVGDYLVSLNPSGQIYPYETAAGGSTGPPLSLNLSSLPNLDEAYVMALLEGPIIAPSMGERPDITSLLAQPAGGGATTGQITGIRLPAFASQGGLQELSLEFGLTGPVQLRLGQRILKRLVLSYVGAINGPVESRRLRFSYEVTPRYTLGWSVNELNEGRFEAGALMPF